MISHPDDLSKLDGNQLFNTWIYLQKQLKYIKDLEMAGRLLCVQRFYNVPASGVIKEDLSIGGKLKLSLNIDENYSITCSLEELEGVIYQLSNYSEYYKNLCDRLFIKSYKINDDVYKKECSKELKEYLSSIITIKRATPTLKIRG